MASRPRKFSNSYSLLSTIKLFLSLNVTCSCIKLFSSCPTLLCIPHLLPTSLRITFLYNSGIEAPGAYIPYLSVISNKMQNEVHKLKLSKWAGEEIGLPSCPCLQNPVCSSVSWQVAVEHHTE